MSLFARFQISRYPEFWPGGEPRVFAIDAEDDPWQHFNLEGANLVTVPYEGGGLGSLFNRIAEATQTPQNGSFQALLENLGDLSEQMPLIVFVKHGDRLLMDVGPALISVLTSWERFTRHGTGVHPMYLLIDVGARATVQAAFYPGGWVDWRA